MFETLMLGGEGDDRRAAVHEVAKTRRQLSNETTIILGESPPQQWLLSVSLQKLLPLPVSLPCSAGLWECFHIPTGPTGSSLRVPRSGEAGPKIAGAFLEARPSHRRRASRTERVTVDTHVQATCVPNSLLLFWYPTRSALCDITWTKV